MSSFVPPPRPQPGPVMVIAEAAQGYEGSADVARLLVRAAAAAGADAVKFQIVYPDEIVTADHQHHALFGALEMPEPAWREAVEEARRCGIGFACDVFGTRSLALATRIGATLLKLHASDFFNDHLVRAARDTGLPLLVSIGGITIEEIDRFLARHGAATATLLYGFQAEPTPTEANHLGRLIELRARYPQTPFGFMDHTAGISDEAEWLAVLAVALGAVLVEKHLTLEPSLGLEDVVSAAGPAVFSRCVARIRAASAALGRSDLGLEPAEQRYRRKAVKAVVATRPLSAGHVIADEDVTLLRPVLADDSEPLVCLDDVVGRSLRVAVAHGTAISFRDLR
jgi:N,N'-diacetyllegionaminate synthase